MSTDLAHASIQVQGSLIALLVAMLVVAAWVTLAPRPSLGSLLAYLPFAVAWLRLDRWVEGRSLVALGTGRGITEADLLPLAIAAVVVLIRSFQPDDRPPARGPAHRL